MLFNTKADLMQASLEGIGGLGALGCGGDCGCGCEKKTSLLDLVGMGDLGDIPWSCSSFGLFCQDPITQQQQDNSDFGGSLSTASRNAATEMAVTITQKDMASNPCSYSETNGMSEIDKLFKCGQFGGNWLVWGVGLAAAALIYKKL